MEIKLKKCPFCGGEMSPLVMCFDNAYDKEYQQWLRDNHKLPSFSTGYSTGWVVHCYHCGARSKEGRSKEEVAKAWNRRDKE